MKQTIAILAAFGVWLGAALAGPPAGRILVLDVAKPDNTFSTLVTRGEAMLIRADLYNRGAVYTNNDLTGFLWYSSNRTDSVGVKMQSTTNAAGSVWFSMSASDSMGLATNDTFPKSYWAQVVLTNSTYRYDWQQGQFVVRDGGGVTGTGVAGAQSAVVVAWSAITGNPTSSTALVAWGATLGVSGGTVTTIVHNVTDGSFLGVTQMVQAATNSAVIDATQRVAAAGYLLPASTSTLATAASVVSATQTIAGATVSGVVPAATWASVAATATNLSDGQTTVSIFTDPGYSTNAMRVGPDGDLTTYLEIDGLSQRMTYVYGGATRWTFGIGQTPSSFRIDNSAYSYLFGASGNVVTNGGSGLSLTGLNTNNASTLDSGTVPLARLSGITTNEMAAAEKIRIDQAVTNGQSGVTLTGTLTPTNELTVTNSLQLGGVAASGYATNAGAAGGGYYAMSNGVWTSFAPGTGTGGGNQTPLTNHVDAAGYSITNLLGLVSTAAVGQVAFRMPFGTYMEWSDGTSTNYVRVTAISAGVVHWLSASNSASVVTNIMQVNP
jgi:hypothetical protein